MTLTFEQIMELFLENRKQIAENSKLLEENGQQLVQLRLQSQETDKKFQETDRQLNQRFKETDKKIRAALGLFTSQWGRLIEALVKPDALRLFQERGFQVHYAMPRVEAHVGGETMELDLLLENGQEVIIMEVKTTLKVDQVNEFINEKLAHFLAFFPRYKDYKIYGGVAAIDVAQGADRHA